MVISTVVRTAALAWRLPAAPVAADDKKWDDIPDPMKGY